MSATRLGGRPVGVLASDPEHYGGGVTADAAEKTARFVDTCDQFHLPVVNLVDVPGAVCGRSETETTSAAYIRCGIGAAAARLSDVVEIQAQWLEWDPATYRAFVEKAAAQARRANPDVVVLAGLSTRFAPEPQTLLSAWDAVSDIVDGHYLAVPEGISPDVAASFLDALARERG